VPHSAITDMRKHIAAHIERVAVTYFDSTKTAPIPEYDGRRRIRNLVSTGSVIDRQRSQL
jgi:hypothetical protein